MMGVKTYIALCLACLLSVMAIPTIDGALADGRAGAIEMGTPGGNTENCRSRHPGTLIAVIVPCIRDTMETTAIEMTDAFDDITMPITFAFMTLVITLFGVKVLTVEGDMKKQSFILLMKIACVMLFAENLGGFIPAVYDMTQEAAEIVTSAMPAGSIECQAASFLGERPWNQLDCLTGDLFGFAPGAIIGSSVFGLMGASLWSGELGVTLFMAGIAALFLMFRLILRTVYTYLMAIIVMTFLIIISPLMIPLLMLSVTFEYFEHWLRSFISTMLQPLFILAYITLAVLILDKMLYDETYGLMVILPADEIQEMWGGKSTTQSASLVNNPGAFYQKFHGLSEDWMGNSFAMVEANPQLSGATSVMPWNELYRYNFGGAGVSKLNKLFFAMVALALVAYLLDLVLGTISQMASFVLGGGFALSRLAGEASILEKKIGEAQNQMQSNWLTGGGDGLRSGMNQGGAAGVGAMAKGIPDAIQGLVGVRK